MARAAVPGAPRRWGRWLPFEAWPRAATQIYKYRGGHSPLAPLRGTGPVDVDKPLGWRSSSRPTPHKQAITAADILRDRVLPYFEEHGVPLLRIPTDRRSECCGNRETRGLALHLDLDLTNIEHTRTKTKSAHVNEIRRRCHQTIQNEFCASAFCTFGHDPYYSPEQVRPMSTSICRATTPSTHKRTSTAAVRRRCRRLSAAQCSRNKQLPRVRPTCTPAPLPA